MADWTLIAALVTALVIFAGGLWAVHSKQKEGWGAYSVQALGLVILLPAILILAAMGKIESSVVATLLGATIGYVLAGRGPKKDE